MKFSGPSNSEYSWISWEINSASWRRIWRISRFHPARLQQLVRRGRIEKVLLALPSVDKTRQNVILKELSALDCEVQVLPTFVEMMNGVVSMGIE